MAKLFGSYVSATKKINEAETLFNKIISPIRKEADPNLIAQLTTVVNTNNEHAQFVLDMITDKMQSPQDWENLIALQTLEALVKNCGDPIHDLIARFRFLNEMIKIISPKYYANRTSDKVKAKCIELIFSWSRGLPKKTKIKDAYDMLKMQRLVKEDPVDVDELVINVAPRHHNASFGHDEDKLARLLKSKNPKDLEMANKLIKEMVQKDEIKMDKSSVRTNELEQINNNIKLLNEMLNQYDKKSTNLAEKETIKYLFLEIEKLHPKIIQLATETEENDESIGEILSSNDQCESVLSKFKRIFENLTNLDLSADDELISLNGPNEDIQNSKKTQPDQTAFERNTFKELEDIFCSIDIKEENKIEYPIGLPTNPVVAHSDLLIEPGMKVMIPQRPPLIQIPKTTEINYFKKETIPAVKNSYAKAVDDLNEIGRILMENSLKTLKNKPMNINEMVKPTASTKQEDKQIH